MLCAPLAMAQYKVVGPDGKVTYTDRPQAAAGHQVTSMGLGSNGGNSGVDTGSLPIALRQVVNRYPGGKWRRCGGLQKAHRRQP
jgi:hypothetical protein